MHVLGRTTSPFFTARNELKLDDSLRAQVKLYAAVELLARLRQHDPDALLKLREHLGVHHDFTEVRRGDFFLALAHQNQIDRRFFSAALESEEGAQEGILRAFLVDGAAPH